MSEPRERIESVAKELGLTMQAKFVPWSQSRNKDEKQPSLNWVVTILREGRIVLATDYGPGCGHCPSYKQNDNTTQNDIRVKSECDTGMWCGGNKKIKPNFCDVLAGLMNDADVLNNSTFEEWAVDFSYDTDSRKAEAIYRACLEIALKLRNSLGEDGLSKLREACQDF